jgi:hypothetical protein
LVNASRHASATRCIGDLSQTSIFLSGLSTATILSFAGIAVSAGNADSLRLQKVDDQIHANVGPAHTPGDSLAWLPEQRFVFSGVVVCVGRMRGAMPHSNSGQIAMRVAITRLHTMSLEVTPGRCLAPTVCLQSGSIDAPRYRPQLRQYAENVLFLSGRFVV